MSISFTDFQKQIRNFRNIWAGPDVYFTQTRSYYRAAYEPNYPNKSKRDKSISWNIEKGKIHLSEPSLHFNGHTKVTEFNSFKELKSHLNTANDIAKTNIDMIDKETELLWDELEDVLFVEAKDFFVGDKDYENDISLVLASDWNGFEAGTSRDSIWHWFDDKHSKGVGWLLNEYEPEEER